MHIYLLVGSRHLENCEENCLAEERHCHRFDASADLAATKTQWNQYNNDIPFSTELSLMLVILGTDMRHIICA